MRNYWITKARARKYFQAIEKHLMEEYDMADIYMGLSSAQINCLLREMRRLFEVHFGEPCRIGPRSLLRAYEKFREHILRS